MKGRQRNEKEEKEVMIVFKLKEPKKNHFLEQRENGDNWLQVSRFHIIFCGFFFFYVQPSSYHTKIEIFLHITYTPFRSNLETVVSIMECFVEDFWVSLRSNATWFIICFPIFWVTAPFFLPSFVLFSSLPFCLINGNSQFFLSFYSNLLTESCDV